ncbi:MAG TPA: ATP-binding protein [Actinomycetota bacterium]|nr:ATP-binding protein [Actinomycetota bacterium]
MGASSTHTPENLRQGAHPTVRHAVEAMLLEERTRWAMRIHDGLTQSVTSAVLELQSLRHQIELDPAGAIEVIEQVEREIREDLRRIRELLFDMTSEAPGSPEPALAALVRDLAARWRLPASIQVDGDVDGVDEPTLEAVHAIVSEAFANAAKHSGAPEAHVRVAAAEGMLHIEIEDRGRGIVPVPDDDPHFGVRIMRARAEALGGFLDVESTPGHGTTVVAELPVARTGG